MVLWPGRNIYNWQILISGHCHVEKVDFRPKSRGQLWPQALYEQVAAGLLHYSWEGECPKMCFPKFCQKSKHLEILKVIYRPHTSLTGYQHVKQFQPEIGQHVHFFLKMIPASSAMQYWFSISEEAGHDIRFTCALYTITIIHRFFIYGTIFHSLCSDECKCWFAGSISE